MCIPFYCSPSLYLIHSLFSLSLPAVCSSFDFIHLVKLLQSICAVRLIRFQHFVPLHRHSLHGLDSFLFNFYFFHLTFALLPRLHFIIRVVSFMHHFIEEFWYSYMCVCIRVYKTSVCIAYSFMYKYVSCIQPWCVQVKCAGQNERMRRSEWENERKY